MKKEIKQFIVDKFTKKENQIQIGEIYWYACKYCKKTNLLAYKKESKVLRMWRKQSGKPD